MGLEQALTYGLMGALGGGASAVKEQADEARKRDAEIADQNAKTERDLAIEQRRWELKAKFEDSQLPNELKKIEALAKAEGAARKESDPAAEALKWEQVNKLRNDRATEKEIKEMRQKLSQAENLARNDPSLAPLVEERRAKLNTMLGSKPEGTYSVREEYNPDTEERKQITERKGSGAPPVQKSIGVTRAQVDTAAKAKGITDPAKLQELYKTYGV